MSMTKIEQVARALCDRDPDAMVALPGREIIKSPNENPYSMGASLNTAPVPAWRLFEAKARAAIEAMREPTEGMQEAALRTIVRENKGVEYGPSLGWKAMIDAALEEKPTD